MPVLIWHPKTGIPSNWGEYGNNFAGILIGRYNYSHTSFRYWLFLDPSINAGKESIPPFERHNNRMKIGWLEGQLLGPGIILKWTMNYSTLVEVLWMKTAARSLGMKKIFNVVTKSCMCWGILM